MAKVSYTRNDSSAVQEQRLIFYPSQDISYFILIILTGFQYRTNKYYTYVIEFGISRGFGWVHSSILVGKPGFRRVQSSDLEFGKPWQTINILFWTQNLLIFGQILVKKQDFFRFLTHKTTKFSSILYLGKSPAISIYWYYKVRSSTSRV